MAVSSRRFCFSFSERPSGRGFVSMMQKVPSLWPSGAVRGTPEVELNVSNNELGFGQNGQHHEQIEQMERPNSTRRRRHDLHSNRQLETGRASLTSIEPNERWSSNQSILHEPRICMGLRNHEYILIFRLDCMGTE